MDYKSVPRLFRCPIFLPSKQTENPTFTPKTTLFMNKSIRTTLLFLLTFPLVFTAISAQKSRPYPTAEFRGAWIATVANIDFPSRPGLSSSQIKVEFDSLMDVMKAMNMNAVFVQIRPAARSSVFRRVALRGGFSDGRRRRRVHGAIFGRTHVL